MGCISGKSKQTAPNPIVHAPAVQETRQEPRREPRQEPRKEPRQEPRKESQGTKQPQGKELPQAQAPLPYNPFWATSTVLALQQVLKEFLTDVRKNKGNTTQSVETIQTILKNIKNNFQNPKYKTIKKSNKIFHSQIGRFKHGIDLMLALGFVQTTEVIYLPEEILRSHVQVKLSDLNIAFKNI